MPTETEEEFTKFPARSDAEILKQTNELARLLLREAGYEVPEGTRFDNTPNPRLKQFWGMACIAQDFLRATDANEAKEEVHEAERQGADFNLKFPRTSAFFKQVEQELKG